MKEDTCGPRLARSARVRHRQYVSLWTTQKHRSCEKPIRAALGMVQGCLQVLYSHTDCEVEWMPVRWVLQIRSLEGARSRVL
jgi:hypothetical protein